MDIGKAFTFVFEDDEWITKVLVGALFVLASSVLIGIPFLIGYMIVIARNVMKGAEKPLPAWDELGEKFKEGLILILIGIVWLIPIWILACLQGVLTVAIADSYGASDTVGLLMTCVGCLYVVWGLVVALMAPALFIRFAETPEFKTGFEFAELWEFTKGNIGNVIIAILLGWVASIISQFGVILCVVGVLATYFWALAVQAHLYGQVYVSRKDALLEPVVVEEEE